jgi:hypothetical protein
MLRNGLHHGFRIKPLKIQLLTKRDFLVERFGYWRERRRGVALDFGIP